MSTTSSPTDIKRLENEIRRAVGHLRKGDAGKAQGALERVLKEREKGKQ